MWPTNSTAVTVIVALAVSPLMTVCEGPTKRSGHLSQIQLERVGGIGELEGPDSTTLGEIIDVETGHRGQIIVLDDLVRGYHPDGFLLGKIGSVGEGPGEIQQPRDIEVTGRGQLAILDPRNSRISVFGVKRSGFRFQHTVELPVPAIHFCEFDGAWFLVPSGPSPLIVRIDSTGAVRDSFGIHLPYPGKEGLDPGFAGIAGYQANGGPLLCVEDEGLIVLAAGSLPFVRAFDTAGTEVWRDTLDAYFPTHWVLDGLTLQGKPGGENGQHYARNLVRWSEDLILLQLEHHFPEREHPDRQFYELESRWIALSQRRQAAQNDSLPWIRAVWGDTVFVVRNLPYPRVEFYER